MYSAQPAGATSVTEEEEIISDLSRRNTIVPPAPIEQIENEMNNLEDGTIINNALIMTLQLYN